MNNKTKTRSLKVAIIAVALLLCLALAIGITGAFYQAKRQATGTLSMDQGIIIDYKGFNGSETGATWERGTTFELFSTKAGEVQPGAHIKVNAAGIGANAESVNFYARVRLEYKFYNGDTEVTLEDPTVLIKTSNLFGSNWEFSSMAAPKDYYYYVENGTTTFKTMVAGADFVELIQSNAEFIIEGEGFKGSNGLEGGGFVVDETTSINKIVVNLVLETLQGDATAEQAKALGWKIASPVKFAEATGKMETSVNKTATTEDLNVSVAGATEVPINEVVFPYDTPTTLKFDSNNVEYITLTYDKGEPDIFDAENYEVEENTFKVKAKSSKGKVTGYTVGLWSDSEYTGFTYSRQNYKEVDDQPTPYDVPNNGLAISGYYNSNSTLLPELPNSKVSIRERDFKSVIPFSDKNNFFDQFYSIAGSLQYPCKLSCTGVSVQFNDINELISWIEQTEKNFNLVSPVTLTNSQFCESTSVFAKHYDVTEIGFGAFYGKTNNSITIPTNITVIGIESFSSLTNLTTITIHESITSVMARAFADCTNLSTIIIESSLIAAENSTESELLNNATKVYVKSDIITVGSYITGSFEKAVSSDKDGYVMYKKA